MHRNPLIPLALTLLLSACAPAVTGPDGGLSVAVLNAPGESRVPGAAEGVVAAAQGLPACCAFEFTRSAPLRFAETHGDIYGSRAPRQASIIARTHGAELAVMVSAPTLERQVEAARGSSQRVTITLQLRATVIDSATTETLATVASRVVSGARTAREDEQLPEVAQDPLTARLSQEAAVDLAPHLLAVLDDLVREHAPGPGARPTGASGNSS